MFVNRLYYLSVQHENEFWANSVTKTATGNTVIFLEKIGNNRATLIKEWWKKNKQVNAHVELLISTFIGKHHKANTCIIPQWLFKCIRYIGFISGKHTWQYFQTHIIIQGESMDSHNSQIYRSPGLNQATTGSLHACTCSSALELGYTFICPCQQRTYRGYRISDLSYLNFNSELENSHHGGWSFRQNN